MIKVSFFYNDELKIRGFELKGHAEFEDYGYDIVCSAVTSNAIGVINSLERLQDVSFLEARADEGVISCIIDDKDVDKSQLLLEHLRLALGEISKEYPKNIRILEK